MALDCADSLESAGEGGAAPERQQMSDVAILNKQEELPARSSGSAPGRTRASGSQILEGARKLFLEEGFDAASMADIARRAGVSKGTLYVYFDSKERLFVELVHLESSNQAEAIFAIDPENHDVGAMLRQVGIGFIEFLTAPHVTRAMRTVIAIGERMEGVGASSIATGRCSAPEALRLSPGAGRRRPALDRQHHPGRVAVPRHVQVDSRAPACFSGRPMRRPGREIEAVVEFGGERCSSPPMELQRRLRFASEIGKA